jgi:predicted NACHT family NTPase
VARRSLKASPEGITILKAALKYKKWSQTFLAGTVGCTRQTIWSLFHGNPVDTEVFLEICTQLGLSENEIVEASQAEERAGEVLEIDELVRQVRAQIKPWIQKRYGSMNVLSMTRPIGLGDIYTNVNILEKITGRKRLALKELEANCLEEDFEHFGFSYLRKKDEPIPGLDAVEQCKKMVVLGKPGAGKTTFLKRIATQCNLGTFHPGLVPIFVPLKLFAESEGHPELLAYIANQLHECKVKDPETKAETLLYEGRALVLLDGLDEVANADSSRVIEGIRQFSERFYNNLYVLTCRIATQEFKLEQFTEVEIADFDDQQIAVFVTKWFELKNPERTESFLRKLKESPRIRELATNPLLLTLLCLGFEESAYFSDSRAALYKESLNVLLKSWDTKKPGIEHEQVYRQLTPDRKEDLLSQLAYQTFEQGQYFFGEDIAKQHISQYIANLPSADTDTKQLDIDSEAVLKSIEGRHGLLIARSQGIYSFSHLTFHEYFTAREVKEKFLFQQVANHITEYRWREVILLTIGMLPNADDFICQLKQTTDTLLKNERELQTFLAWASNKTQNVEASYKQPAIRAYYLWIGYDFNDFPILGIDSTLDSDRGFPLNIFPDVSDSFQWPGIYDFWREPDPNPTYNCNLDYNLDLDGLLNRVMWNAFGFANIDSHDSLQNSLNDYLLPNLIRELNIAINLAKKLNLPTTLNQKLLTLKNEIPNLDHTTRNIFEQWWISHGQNWAERLREIIIQYRNIGYDWHFTPDQLKKMELYLSANRFLIYCLNSDCVITRSVREEIENTLLLPIAEIEKRKSK